MAKDKEQKLARILYVDNGKSAKEIAESLKVSEQTISKWVNKGNWKDVRSAKVTNPENRVDNIKNIINDLTEQRIALSKELKDAEKIKDQAQIAVLRKSIWQVDDAVSKWNKTLENLDKENRIQLSVYVKVMTMIFDSLKHHDEKLFMKTMDFQETHLNEVATTFKS